MLTHSLTNLQEYMKKKVVERGFDDETEKETVLLLAEELGELSKAVKGGCKEDIGEELADILAYLLILANKFDINLHESFCAKNTQVDARKYTTHEPLEK